MTTTITYTTGRFVWRELHTFKDMPMGDMTYTLASNGDEQIAGLMALSPDSPMHTSWLAYVSVPDVDASQQAAEANGGTVGMPAMDVEGIGRMAMLVDPQGAAFSVFRAVDGDPAIKECPAAGDFGWNSLVMPKPDASGDFYAKVLGWKTLNSHGMTLFATGDRMEGNVQQGPQDKPAHWVNFVVVDDLDVSRESAASLGAHVIDDRHEIPGVGTIAVLKDPQGAIICLFQGKGAH